MGSYIPEWRIDEVMWDSQEKLERIRELRKDVASKARIVILDRMKRDYGFKRFFVLEYWSILLIGL
jgi:hypothetical protein